MSDLRKAAEMALEALETHVPYTYKDRDYEPIQALRQALAQPEQEPVAWMWKDGSLTSDPDEADGTWTKLYTAPPKHEWVGLTEEEVHWLWMDMGGRPKINGYDFAKAIEAKLKEKNT